MDHSVGAARFVNVTADVPDTSSPSFVTSNVTVFSSGLDGGGTVHRMVVALTNEALDT